MPKYLFMLIHYAFRKSQELHQMPYNFVCYKSHGFAEARFGTICRNFDSY